MRIDEAAGVHITARRCGGLAGLRAGRARWTCCPTGKSLRFIGSDVKPLIQKYFSSVYRKYVVVFVRPASDQRGVRVVTNVGSRMRWTLVAARDERQLRRTAKACGPDPPTLGSSPWTISWATVATKPGTPGRARYRSSHHRAGNAGVFGVPVVTCLRAFFMCTQGCGCGRGIRHSLRPLSSRDIVSSSPGHFVPRECRRLSLQPCFETRPAARSSG
jgi:hypothetical protein